MKLWLISQTYAEGYDTYDSAVVAAIDQEAARKTHPGGDLYDPPSWSNARDAFAWNEGSVWALTPDMVDVKLIGEAVPGTEAGVICASFNAG